MDAGLNETARFLAMRPPFDSLAAEELFQVVAESQIEFYPSGGVILSEDGGPVTFLRVIHSGGVDIVHDGKLLDLLKAGDTFGHAAMMSGLPPGFEARASQDTLCYRVPVAVARPLLERARDRELRVGFGDPARQPVARLVRSNTVRCASSTSVRDVAQRMTDAGATAAIVDAADGSFGIVTDRDMRSRIVAKGLAPDSPVADVISAPVFSVPPDRLGGEVLFEMLERGIHHAPIVNERGQLVGVVEDADLFAIQPRSWWGVRRSIARARDVESLAHAARRLPELFLDLHASSLRALEVARVLSALMDAVTVRALELSAQGVGLPTDGLVWVAVGSQARRELTPASIARGAIVCSDPPPTSWVEAAARALKSCGCSGEATARTTREWTAGDLGDELVLTVLVERRPLWGTPRDPLPTAENGVREPVLAALARRSLAYQPPTGFDEDAVLEADGTRHGQLDIRRAAVIPIVELARWAGAAAGLVDGSTEDRLRAAAQAGVLGQSDARNLVDSFEMAVELRLAHHMEQLAAGGVPDDLLDPSVMSPLARDHLRDVFRAVTAVQKGLRD